jgi:hypothetical protein
LACTVLHQTLQRTNEQQLPKRATQNETAARTAYRSRRGTPDTVRQARYDSALDHFRELRHEIEHFDIGYFPSVEDAYAIIEDLVGGLGGKMFDIGYSRTGMRPIKQVSYGTGRLLSGRVNLAHPNEPYGLRALLVELQMCKHDRSLLRRMTRSEIPILDVDGYEAQGWLDERLSNDPATAIRQYAFGFERPFHGRGLEWELPDGRWPMQERSRSPESRALTAFVRSQPLDVYTSRHGYGLERGPLWLMRPYPTPTEAFRALATAAHMQMVDMEPEEFWEIPYAGEQAMVRASGNTRILQHYAARNMKPKFNLSGNYVVVPFSERNRSGAFGICDQPLFVVRSMPWMPQHWTKRKVMEKALRIHKKLLAPIEDHMNDSSTPDSKRNLWDLPILRRASPMDQRIARSAGEQYTLSVVFINLYEEELATRNDLEQEASDSFTYDHLYAKTFYAMLRTALMLRVFETELAARSDISAAIRSNVEEEIDRYCRDLEIEVTEPADQILACAGTTELTERFVERTLLESGQVRHLHRRHRASELAGIYPHFINTPETGL